MQKGRLGFIGLALGMILFSQTVLAACDGGTEFTGKNGKTFCVSDVSVHWWGAFAWCESQGMKLASMDDICYISEEERWLGGSASGSCPNVVSMGPNKWAWSSLGSGTTNAYRVNLSSGEVDDIFYRYYTYYAVCQ